MTAAADTPASLGFAMPPEWAEHAATWTSWPFDDELWEGQLEVARRDFAGMITVIARFEPVILNVGDEDTERDARARLEAAGADLSNITFNRLPLNDVWFRDNGPLFIRNANGEVAMTDWKFNAWGGKYAPWHLDDEARSAWPGNSARPLRVPHVMEGGA